MATNEIIGAAQKMRPLARCLGTREEHLRWCKLEARYLIKRGFLADAFTAFAANMNMHARTRRHRGLKHGIELLMRGELATASQMLAYIDSFL